MHRHNARERNGEKERDGWTDGQREGFEFLLLLIGLGYPCHIDFICVNLLSTFLYYFMICKLIKISGYFYMWSLAIGIQFRSCFTSMC